MRRLPFAGPSFVHQCPVTLTHRPGHNGVNTLKQLHFKILTSLKILYKSTRYYSYEMLELKKKVWTLLPNVRLPYLHLLLQLSFLLSVHSDGEVLGGVHCRVTGADLVGVKGPLQCVPLL